MGLNVLLHRTYNFNAFLHVIPLWRIIIIKYEQNKAPAFLCFNQINPIRTLLVKLGVEPLSLDLKPMLFPMIWGQLLFLKTTFWVTGVVICQIIVVEKGGRRGSKTNNYWAPTTYQALCQMILHVCLHLILKPNLCDLCLPSQSSATSSRTWHRSISDSESQKEHCGIIFNHDSFCVAWLLLLVALLQYRRLSDDAFSDS